MTPDGKKIFIAQTTSHRQVGNYATETEDEDEGKIKFVDIPSIRNRVSSR